MTPDPSSTQVETEAPLMSVVSLSKSYGLRKRRAGHRGTGDDQQMVVKDVSFDLRSGEILGLAGGSGSGKTTLSRCITRLVEPDQGSITFEGQDVLAARGRQLREFRRQVQMVFQDPYASLNPRMRVGTAIHEAGRVHGSKGSEHRERFVGDLLQRVGLRPETAGWFPSRMSGGQRQRVAVARALAVEPQVIIADEAVSALDVSVQLQLLNLFLELKDDLGLTMIFIAHQLPVIAEIADRVAIMQSGEIVEIGPTEQVFTAPQFEYTKKLLEAVPRPAFE